MHTLFRTIIEEEETTYYETASHFQQLRYIRIKNLF